MKVFRVIATVEAESGSKAEDIIAAVNEVVEVEDVTQLAEDIDEVDEDEIQEEDDQEESQKG